MIAIDMMRKWKIDEFQESFVEFRVERVSVAEVLRHQLFSCTKISLFSRQAARRGMTNVMVRNDLKFLALPGCQIPRDEVC